MTAETRAVTQVNGVRNEPDFLVATLTVVHYSSTDNRAVKTTPIVQPIVKTPPPAHSAPAQPPQRRYQHPHPPNPLQWQPNNGPLHHHWIPQTIYGLRLK